jgi:branched-chain amino acid transport system permease protein
MIAYATTVIILILIAMLLGFALNLQWGTAGLVNFGLTGFFALGAYSTAIAALAGIPPFFAVLIAAFLCAVGCAGIASISVRLSDEYLAILTLGFSEVVGLVALSEEKVTGGSLGLSGVPRPLAGWIGPSYYESAFLALLLAVVAAIYIVLELLLRSQFGLALRASREDDVVAETLGKDVLALRIKAFAAGGAIIGIAGAFHAFYLTYVDPSQFATAITGYTFMAVILGGRGSNAGLAIGAALIMTVFESTRFLKDSVSFLDATQLASLRLIFVGLGLVLLLLYRPQGLFREWHVKSTALLRSPDRQTLKLQPKGLS